MGKEVIGKFDKWKNIHVVKCWDIWKKDVFIVIERLRNLLLKQAYSIPCSINY